MGGTAKQVHSKRADSLLGGHSPRRGAAGSLLTMWQADINKRTACYMHASLGWRVLQALPSKRLERSVFKTEARKVQATFICPSVYNCKPISTPWLSSPLPKEAKRKSEFENKDFN
uniref:Uncharacterized protein n=1 Tax=Sphaerodactylus townsendi TaxID=933632 RepID=A0ACB8FL07_9SAUR